MKTASAKCCPSCGERYDADVLFCPRDGTPLVSARSPSFASAIAERDPYVGVELGGQIRIKSLIGIGSMGRVYRAFQGGIDRDVAVKILHRELSGNAELVERFHREARVASRLVHANVVQVLMTGNIAPQQDARVGGEIYLVMEHLDGISLLSALAAGGEGAALPLPRALHIALQICDAVGEAHAQGIVHRDLKPENVMLVRRGDDPDYVKVLDFGIARLTRTDKAMATQAGLIFGTAKYISPEGAEGLPVGPPGDVYSIATILYQCLAGRAPFEGDSHVTLLMHHAHTPPPPLTGISRASYVPTPIAGVIMQNLAKKPGDRAPDGKALGRDLINAARESGLFPEEFVPQSALLLSARQGAVKLASKERTKALDLSPDLAARIGGVPGRLSDAPEPTERSSSPMAAATSERARATSEDAGRPSEVSEAKSDDVPPRAGPPQRAPERAPAPAAIMTAPAATTTPPLSEPTQQATIQGTETSLTEAEPRPTRPPRARAMPIAVVAAFVAGAAAITIVNGKSGGDRPATTARDSIEEHIEEARASMRRRAWEEPQTPNVKSSTARALERWPGDPRVRELRQEAASLIVADALGRKYAGDLDGAIHLADLAFELAPTLITAQRLADELRAERAQTNQATPPSAQTNAAEQPSASPPKPEPRREPRKTQGPALKSETIDTTPAQLPPSPPPLSTSTPPASSGPWL